MDFGVPDFQTSPQPQFAETQNENNENDNDDIFIMIIESDRHNNTVIMIITIMEKTIVIWDVFFVVQTILGGCFMMY